MTTTVYDIAYDYMLRYWKESDRRACDECAYFVSGDCELVGNYEDEAVHCPAFTEWVVRMRDEDEQMKKTEAEMRAAGIIRRQAE